MRLVIALSFVAACNSVTVVPINDDEDGGADGGRDSASDAAPDVAADVDVDDADDAG